MVSVIMLFFIRLLYLYFTLYYMLFSQDELLNTKLSAPKNGTFERGNFHSVSGGIISRVSFTNQKNFQNVHF